MFSNDWNEVLKDVMSDKWFLDMIETVKNEYKVKSVFPKQTDIFKAFNLTSFKDTKVVILGQDPYHGINEAHGLAFSVYENIKTPPSLLNIFKELYDDLGIKRTNSDLSDWANQGVLLLNSILTVVKDTPLSHSSLGWEKFTDYVIKKLSDRGNVIFVLWGSFARSKKVLISSKTNYIIESAHPSPLSCYRGFFGSKPFSKVNAILKKNGLLEINW